MLINEKNLAASYEEMKVAGLYLIGVPLIILTPLVVYDEEWRMMIFINLWFMHPYFICLAFVVCCQKIRRKICRYMETRCSEKMTRSGKLLSE